MERARLKELIRSTGRAVEEGSYMFLTDPSWGHSERADLASLTTGANQASGDDGWLCIPTGGTSGRVRFARHDEKTIAAAVSGFCLHFAVARVNAVSVLPLHHVSGLMARLRCAGTGGEYLQWDWKKLASGDYPQLRACAGDWYLSLVPTQLRRLLERPDAGGFLRQFRTVFLGGGPTWTSLGAAAAEAKVPIALSYGMTETAAMVAAQTPRDFLAGARDAGRPLPHVQIEIIEAEDSDGESGGAGRIRVRGESVFRGYFPEYRPSGVYDTEDVGRFNSSGALEILGRADSGIITGGKKVWPSEVEAALLATGLVEDVAVLGLPDPTWGEKVVACFPSGADAVSIENMKRALGDTLSSFKYPKQLFPISTWPRNAQGKLNRAALKEQLRSNL